MIHWLTDPYQSEFMQNAGVVALIVGVLSPTVGVWVVLRRLAYMGDAMSHATLAGVAGAYLLGVSITLGALAAGLLMGAAVALLSSNRRLTEDAIIGIVETGLFALGVILISRGDIGIDLGHFLFGQITTITEADLVINGGLALIALTAVFICFDDLRMTTFDPLHAAQVGVTVTGLRFVLLLALSIAIVVCLSTVGILMSIAMLVVPASTARMMTERTTTMTSAAIGFGVTSSMGGLTLSYHLASPPGATIALVAVSLCIVVFVMTRAKRARHRAIVPATSRPF
jgi:ABC-type Mn2+/Zn2+ transport system permease subunit